MLTDDTGTVVWDADYEPFGEAVVKCRRVLSRTAVRIYLSNETAYDVPWDTVLMACEKKYEHFGGLTRESKKIVNEWLSNQ